MKRNNKQSNTLNHDKQSKHLTPLTSLLQLDWLLSRILINHFFVSFIHNLTVEVTIYDCHYVSRIIVPLNIDHLVQNKELLIREITKDYCIFQVRRLLKTFIIDRSHGLKV